MLMDIVVMSKFLGNAKSYLNDCFKSPHIDLIKYQQILLLVDLTSITDI